MSKTTKAAAAELHSLPYERKRLESLRLELEAINTALYSPRGATLSAVPTHGGGNRQEDKIIGIIDNPRRDTLMRLIGEQEKRLELIESTLALLSPLERRLINEMYVNGNPMPIADLMLETNYSDRQIYRICYAALTKYAYARGMDAKL